MKEPVDHIIRPQLPWRSGPGMTECGYDASKVKALSRSEFNQRLKDCGQQRTAMMTCMTCSDTARRHGTWEDDPREAIHREVEWENKWHRKDRGCQLQDELFAIARLIEAHRDEFDALVVATQRQRDWNAQKAALAKKAPATKPQPL